MTFLDELDDLAEDTFRGAVKLLEDRAREDPRRLFKLLRTVKPIVVRNGLAIVTQYDDVREVLTRDETFSVEPYRGKMQDLAGDFILGTDDSPAYERDVSILRLAAPRSDVPVLAGFVTETADALVDEAGGRIDVADLAKRVPARLIGRWFGTPGPDEDTMIAWTLAMFEAIFVNLKDDPEIHARAKKAGEGLRSYLDALIAQRKASGGPADDVLGRLIALQAASPAAFTDEEIRMNIIGLVCGFVPTIATATTFAIDELLDRPEALAGARAADDDALRAYMFEALRFAPQGPGLFRKAQRDCVIAEGTHHETELRKGTTVFAATQSAMNDDDVVDDPGEFRTDRPRHHYMHFGVGMHECFGRFASTMAIPLIAKALLRREDLQRAGPLIKAGPFPESLLVTYRP
jgi:cytochrome P450